MVGAAQPHFQIGYYDCTFGSNSVAFPLLVNLPILFWAYLLGKDEEILSRKCLLSRALGYTREALYLFATWLVPAETFF